MFNCQQCQTEIDAAQRPETLNARVAEHLSSCAACRAFRTERESLRRLIGELEPVGAPPDFEFRLRARMQARQSAAGPFGFSLFAPRAVGLALAASLVLTFAVMLRLHSRPPQPGGDPGARQEAAQGPKPAAVPEQAASLPHDVVVAPALDNAHEGVAISVPLKTRRQLATRRTERARASSLPLIRPVPEDIVLGVRGTSVITAGGAGEQTAALPPIPVSVSGSAQPLKVLLKDTQGTARLVSIEAVSFGSRDLLAGRAQMTPVKATNDRGVW